MRNLYSIFLVDDDKDDQYVFRECLDGVDASIKLITADDGIDALAKLHTMECLPDLAFIDLNMPRMNGKSLLRELKSSPVFKTMPVIVYSTSSSPNDIQETKSMGATDFVTKPHSYDELCELITNILNGHS